ncbi:MAG: hypothetical protein M1546_23880, partial [Chloroflexi bacterium]|nr:hypothetical protein [Chloroflexota bacterium]
SRRVAPQFSYLDARHLRMVFDPRSPETGEVSSNEPLSQPDADGKFPVELSLKDLLALHDWQHGSSSDKPILPDAAEALLRVCCNVDAAEEWASWKREKLDPLKDRQSGTGWKDDSILRNVCLDLPSAQNLETAVEVLLIALKLPAKTGCIPLGKAALNAGFVLISDLCQWLDGGWLESAVLQRLICLRKTHHLQSPLINVIPKKGGTRFEVDVVATRGYQLFAVSCSTDAGHFLLKHKLFEATVRARQIGGDEARIALVCCSDHPEWVQAEMRRDLDPHVTVFGRDHLLELCKKLSDWIAEPTGAGV